MEIQSVTQDHQHHPTHSSDYLKAAQTHTSR